MKFLFINYYCYTKLHKNCIKVIMHSIFCYVIFLFFFSKSILGLKYGSYFKPWASYFFKEHGTIATVRNSFFNIRESSFTKIKLQLQYYIVVIRVSVPFYKPFSKCFEDIFQHSRRKTYRIIFRPIHNHPDVTQLTGIEK